MEEVIENLSADDLFHLENISGRNKRWMRKAVGYACLILGFTFFMPLEILTRLRRSGRNMHYDSSFLFFEFGPQNVLFFIIIPVIIILALIYFYLLRIPQTKKDLSEQKKIIGTIKVNTVKEISDTMKKDLHGIFDHEITFEPNNYKIKAELFSSARKPEYLTAKAYRVEVTKYAHIELKREVID